MTGPGPSAATNTGRSPSLLGDEAFLRSLEQLSLVVRRVAKPGLNGDHRGVTRANSSEFADYRRYTVGDDFRRIDWNLYGRLGSLFVRLSEAREDINVHILLDTSRSMDYGAPNKLDYAKRLAASLGYLALSRLDAVSVNSMAFSLGEKLNPLRGKNRSRRLLSYLDELKPAGATDLNASLAQYADRSGPAGMVIIISDLLAPGGFESGLERVRGARLEASVLQILSPAELAPEPMGEVELIDRETGEIVEVTVSHGVLEQYRERLAAFLAANESACHRLGVGYQLLNTVTPLETAILTELRQRRILQ